MHKSGFYLLILVDSLLNHSVKIEQAAFFVLVEILFNFTSDVNQMAM